MKAIDIVNASIEEAKVGLREDMKFWGKPELMARALADVKGRHSSGGSVPPGNSVEEAVNALARERVITSASQLHLVTYGLCTPIPSANSSLIDDPGYMDLVLASVAAFPIAGRSRLIYGLSQSYFAFPKYDNCSDAGRSGWTILRDFISAQLSAISEALRRVPRWLECARINRGVFGSSPGDFFGSQLLAGITDGYEQFTALLGIPTDSWFRQDVLLGQVRAACGLVDSAFVECLSSMMPLILPGSQLKPSRRVSQIGIGMLLHRYSEVVSNSEHPELRDAALQFIGNPWLRPHDWALHVLRPDGTSSDEARDLVTGWLKRRLITDFFGVLAADGATDQRRLKYWLQYANSIDDLWLFLGEDTMRSVRPALKEIRQRADGRIMQMKGAGSSSNNAFGMKMGALWIIEFGQTGNACYAYRGDAFPVRLKSGSIISGDSAGLKKRDVAADRMLHIDSGFGRWEAKFTSTLRRYGFAPDRKPTTESAVADWVPPHTSGTASIGQDNRSQRTSAPSPVNLAYLTDLITGSAFRIDDNRASGGALWLKGPEDAGALMHHFRRLGFEHRPGRGWWYRG